MEYRLTHQQRELRESCKYFVEQNLAPKAARIDSEQKFSRDDICLMGMHGLLAPLMPEALNGLGCNYVTFSLLNEEINKACSTARGLITVTSMMCYAIMRWGSDELKNKWLSGLACGEFIGAFAVSEPDSGSQIQAVTLSVVEQGDNFILNGTKKWISFGQIADVFLVFGLLENQSVACLVDRKSENITVNPINNMMGCRGSMLAEIQFHDCAVPKKNLIGGVGLGIPAVALSALSVGRVSVAAGCVGMAQAAMESAFDYGAQRRHLGSKLIELPLVNRMLAEMKTQTAAARALYFQAGDALDHNAETANTDIMIAKYYSGTMVNNVLRDVMQIFGAAGLCEGSLVERFFRDAKIMEIIEGSNEVLQLELGKNK